MNKQFIISSVNYPDICLRTILDNDQDNLREWKNDNRKSFFYQNEISEASQQEWFRGYLERSKDYMFIVAVEKSKIGCMGIRFMEDAWDIYNVILGDTTFSGKGHMGQALHLMCSFVLDNKQSSISAKVLSNNPAINWYKKNAFRVVSEQDDYFEIVLVKSRFEPCPITQSMFGGQ